MHEAHMFKQQGKKIKQIAEVLGRYCQMLWMKKEQNPSFQATSSIKFPSLQKTP